MTWQAHEGAAINRTLNRFSVVTNFKVQQGLDTSLSYIPNMQYNAVHAIYIKAPVLEHFLNIYFAQWRALQHRSGHERPRRRSAVSTKVMVAPSPASRRLVGVTRHYQLISTVGRLTITRA